MNASAEASIIRSNLYDRPPRRTWSQGRVTLVGDAAHPMLPNAAQGACQALEDAVALAETLGSRPLGEALAAYEARRLRSANRLVSQARQTARMVQAGNPFVTGARDFIAAHVPWNLLLKQLDSQMGPPLASPP